MDFLWTYSTGTFAIVTASVYFAVPLSLKRIFAAPVMLGLIITVNICVATPLELAVRGKAEL
ncbi:hypothetical protein D3C75_1225640 [compost metagenome]